MPRKPTGQHRTALGTFIEESRRERGLTQAQFQESLDVELGDRYVSKVESGQIRRPNKEFLEALSKLSGVGVEELRRWAGEPARAAVAASPPREPRILFGHCLWSVPVFLAAHGGNLEGFNVASLKASDGGVKWIEPRSKHVDLRVLAADAEPMSAADVLSALRHDQADIGVVPGDVARRHPDFLLRTGVVFDGSAGMVLLFPEEHVQTFLSSPGGVNPEAPADTSERASGKRRSEARGGKAGVSKNGSQAVGLPWESAPGSITSRQIGHGLCQLVMEGKKPFVGLDEATVARDVYKDIERAGREAARDIRPPVDLDAGRWHLRTADLDPKSKWTDLMGRLDGEHPQSNLVGLITWDPLATWIANASASTRLARRQILALHGPADWPRHFTFEVVIRKSDAQDRALVGRLNDLLSQLWQVTAGFLSSDDGDLDADTLDAIAAYFGLDQPKREAKNVLSTYRYVTYWYEGTRTMLSGRRLPA